jgi:RimJ/RimL family protein N-acetyltransferase
MLLSILRIGKGQYMGGSNLTIHHFTHKIRYFITSHFLRSSSSMLIRRVKKSDATQLLLLFSTLNNETPYMFFDPEEQSVSVKEQRDQNTLFAMSDTNVMFVAEYNQQLVGFIRGVNEANNQYPHSLHIVVGVVKAAWKQGIGNALMQTLEQWGRRKDYRYLELSVMDINQAALMLYTKRGFSKDALVTEPMIVEDRIVCEVQMSKRL